MLLFTKSETKCASGEGARLVKAMSVCVWVGGWAVSPILGLLLGEVLGRESKIKKSKNHFPPFTEPRIRKAGEDRPEVDKLLTHKHPPGCGGKWVVVGSGNQIDIDGAVHIEWKQN